MTPQSIKQLGLCSWSGNPSGPEELVERLKEVGLSKIQLAIDPLYLKPDVWGDAKEIFDEAGIQVVSGMFETQHEDYSSPVAIRKTGGVAYDPGYESVLERLPAIEQKLDAYGITLISYHAGFIPHDTSNPDYEETLNRIRRIAEQLGESGKVVILETGQETAKTLVEMLDNLGCDNVKVNFDPGNMLLYSMGDPIESLRILMPHIRQIHIKDAVASGDPDVWGEEKPAGEGEVDWTRFFQILAESDYTGDFIIEREVGDDFTGEIKRARNYLSSLLDTL